MNATFILTSFRQVLLKSAISCAEKYNRLILKGGRENGLLE